MTRIVALIVTRTFSRSYARMKKNQVVDEVDEITRVLAPMVKVRLGVTLDSLTIHHSAFHLD